ncbi:MAG: SRPBCC domain-containing protein [Bacteroidota bacterium]
MKDVIRKEHSFNFPIEKVWDAISKADEISSWFVKADFKAESGYAYTFSSLEEDCPKITGVVKHAKPFTLIYTWIVEGTDIETVVKWELTENDKGTKLVLEHSGISNYPENSAVTFFASFDAGWNGCMHKLETFLPKQIHAR